MGMAFDIAAVVFTFLTFLVVFAVFIWAAKKDGDDQKSRERGTGPS